MKINRLIILFIITSFISCKIQDTKTLPVLNTLKSKNVFSYNESLLKWTELKNKNGNSYVYQTTFTSWTGLSNTTELKIVDGKVISRNYQSLKKMRQLG